MTDAFPPTSAAEVLALCDGAWMSLRSQLQPADSDEGWHTSEKGELKLSWTASENTDELGRMEATPPSGQSTVLTFWADGRLEGSGGQQGRWELQVGSRIKLWAHNTHVDIGFAYAHPSIDGHPRFAHCR